MQERFFRTSLAGLVSSAANPESRWRSIILLSFPRPAHRLAFEHDSGSFDCFLPPTYVEYRRLSGRLLRDLRKFMGRDFPKTAILRAPLKRLAARSGLAAYGRNNVTYSGDYGSYHQLVGFASEAELEPFCDDGPVASPQLPACARCSACFRSCPTGAIDPKRFLLHAEKCFTLLNENPGILPPVRAKLPGEMNLPGRLPLLPDRVPGQQGQAENRTGPGLLHRRRNRLFPQPTTASAVAPTGKPIRSGKASRKS